MTRPRRDAHRYLDRRDAGRQLAQVLERRRTWARPMVLALPRGGVPVAYEVALQLDAPLDVFVVRKIGDPTRPELGVGAVAEGGTRVVDRGAQQALGITDAAMEAQAAAEETELERRVARYRGSRPLRDLAGHEVILVDDGLATGVTARAALQALADRAADDLTLAVPVGAPATVRELTDAGVQVECPVQPPGFYAVGAWYDRFDATSDDEVVDLLARADRR